MKTLNGFSLIEIMLAILIAGIVTTFSVPLYDRHLQKQHRLAAETALLKISAALEHQYIQHNSYAGVPLEKLHFPPINQHYKYHINADAGSYVVAAEPVNKQAKDTHCGTISLTSQGEKKISGNGMVDECW